MMRSFSPAALLALAIISLSTGVVSIGFQQALQPPPATAFVGVHLVPMDVERVVEDQTVIVSDGRIAQIGPANKTAVPAGAQRIDGKGKYLMPGLSDMHVHLPPMEGNKGDAADIHMRLFLANGVTTVRGMMGHPANLALRQRIASGELAGPTIVAASPPVHAKNAPTAADGAKIVTEYKDAGFDLIKVWEGLSPEAYASIADTARKLGMPIAGHVTATIGLDRALAAGQSSIEHLDGYLQALMPNDAPVPPPASQVVLGPALKQVDESRMKTLAEETRKAGVFNTPTLTLFQIVVSEDPADTFLKWPEMRYISPALREQFAKQKAGTSAIQAPLEERQRYLELRDRMVKALADAGAPILAGPDSPQMFLVPGFATHRELRSLVEAGLSPYQAIASGTISPARYLQRQTESGTVEVGKRADLLLVDGNPLADVANVQRLSGVMVRGVWMPDAELQKMLADTAALYSPK